VFVFTDFNKLFVGNMTCKIRVNIICVIIICVFIILPCSCTTPNLSHPSLPDDIALTAKVGEEPIFLKLRLETGEELLFMLDTGAPGTILDKSLEAKLGKRLGSRKSAYGWKANGKPTFGIYAAPTLYLGNVRLQTGNQVYTDDLTRIWPGRPMMGILGMDCLQNYCVQLDFQAKKLRFLDADHLSDGDCGRAFPLTFNGCVFTRMDFFGDKSVRFMVDTAEYSDGALNADLFSLALQMQESVWTQQWKQPNGTPTRQAYLSECAINNETYTNLVFWDCSMGAIRSQNMIGLHFLARNLVTFNFPKRVMYLKQTSVGPLSNRNP
jgi:hypothetical protein